MRLDDWMSGLRAGDAVFVQQADPPLHPAAGQLIAAGSLTGSEEFKKRSF